jgi:hypothetical protein
VSGAAVLLAEIRAAGVDVGLDDGVLRVRAPKGILTAAQRARLVEHHAEIISLLAEPANDREALADDLRAIFDERAAIAEIDGGLNRDAAERLARDEVTSGPPGDDVTSWRAWMRSRLPVWQARGLSRAEAAPLVWAEAESAWHRRHGVSPDLDRCAGCGEWMLDGPGMRLLDGAVVHFGNPDRLDCLVLYGETWRAAASAGLMALGLRKPA